MAQWHYYITDLAKIVFAGITMISEIDSLSVIIDFNILI